MCIFFGFFYNENLLSKSVFSSKQYVAVGDSGLQFVLCLQQGLVGIRKERESGKCMSMSGQSEERSHLSRIAGNSDSFRFSLALGVTGNGFYWKDYAAT